MYKTYMSEMSAPCHNHGPRPYYDILNEPVAVEAESGAGSYIAPRLKPEIYPGDHPETTGFIVDADMRAVYGARWNTQSSLWVNNGDFAPVIDYPGDYNELKSAPLDTWLQEHASPPLEERYPLTVFGSNRNPGQLIDKFHKQLSKELENGVDYDEAAGRLLFVPAFNGLLKGFDTVYCSTLGNLGYGYATLYTGQETEHTEVEVSVLFVTKEQLAVIKDSEKDYIFAGLGEVEMGALIYDDTPGYSFQTHGAPRLPAYASVGKTGVYLVENGGYKVPVALSESYARGRILPDMSQAAFQSHHLEQGDKAAKALTLGLVKALKDRGVTSRDMLESLDPGNLSEDLAQAAEDAKETLTPEAYREYMRIGGSLGKIHLRRFWKRVLNELTPKDRVRLIDVTNSDKVTEIGDNVDDLSKWGDLVK